jgi:glycosyltransferase involved in cell wall biosynthesis
VLCNDGVQGRQTTWDGITCYPSDGLWGNVALSTFVEVFEADQVIALCDAWVLRPDEWHPEAPGAPVAVWTPVDHFPIPPGVLGTLKNDRIQPLSMSRFGDQLMDECGLDPLYVPHSVDTSVFRPNPEIRDAVRDELDIPRDAFLVGMVAANQSGPICRKSFPQAFHAFAVFAREHPDAWLYAHTNAKPIGGGIALDLVAEAVGMPPGRLRFPHDHVWQIGIPSRTLAAIYQAFDVLLMPSMGEGFGIPLVEAQACGVPVITSDHSAMTELVGPGWLVEGDPFWDSIQNSFFSIPSIGSIAEKLEYAYEGARDPALRSAAVEFASAYDADEVARTYWKPALDALAGGAETRGVRVAATPRVEVPG